MKIRIINISPAFLNKTDKKFKLIEEMLEKKINRIQNKIDTCYEEIDLLNQFIDGYGNDIELTKYMNKLYYEIMKYEHYKINSNKTMKKIKKKKKRFEIIKFICE